MKRLIYILLITIAFKANAQVTDTPKVKVIDTLKKDLLTAPDTVKHLHSSTAALIPPAILVAYGVSNFYISPVRRFDKWIYGEAYEHDVVTPTRLENFFQYTPMVAVYALNLVGVHGKNTFIDRTLILVMAQSMLQLTTYTLKRSTHRLRPDNSDRLSFPSGHTGNAFAGAEFMSQELSEKSVYYGLIGYAFATTTGIFRIYHQDHWFSDVIAGAGFGILSTKAAYLLYPLVRNRLTKAGREKEKNKDVPDLKKKQSSALLMPSYQDGSFGLQFTMQF